MGKTLRKFSRKGKKTQIRRKTKGKKPTRRKSVRRNKFKGGDASQDIKTKVDEAAKLVFEKPETPNNLKQAKKILEELSESGQSSCSTSTFGKAFSKIGLGTDNKNQDCEKAKSKEYMKAMMLLQKISTDKDNNYDLSDKLEKKASRGLTSKDIVSISLKISVELQKEEMYALMNAEPDHYLDEENDNGLHRAIIDVFERGSGIKSHEVVLEGNEKQVLEGWIRQANVQDRNVATFTEGDLKETYDEVKAKFLNENPGVLKENPRDKWCRENPRDCANINNAINRMKQPKIGPHN